MEEFDDAHSCMLLHLWSVWWEENLDSSSGLTQRKHPTIHHPKQRFTSNHEWLVEHPEKPYPITML